MDAARFQRASWSCNWESPPGGDRPAHGGVTVCGPIQRWRRSRRAYCTSQTLTSGIDRACTAPGPERGGDQQAEQAIVSLNAAIQEAAAPMGSGSCKRQKGPGAGWLLCIGGPVPPDPALCACWRHAPQPSQPGDRYRTVYFCGVPEGE